MPTEPRNSEKRHDLCIEDLHRKPGTLGDMVKAASTVSADIRKNDYGKLEGYWMTEIGPLNQVLHMWSYNSFEERAKLRGDLSKNPRWTGEYIPLIRPLLLHQSVRLMNAIKPPVAPASTGNVYELRNYRGKPAGGLKQWLDAFTAVLPARARNTQRSSASGRPRGQPNKLSHLGYPTFNTARGARPYHEGSRPGRNLTKGPGFLEEMHSTIMCPRRLAVEVRASEPR